MDLVDDAVLKREQSEQEMAVCGGGHDMAPIVVGRSAQAPAFGAGPGIQSRWLDYRKSAMRLHTCRRTSSDGRDRSWVDASSSCRSRTAEPADIGGGWFLSGRHPKAGMMPVRSRSVPRCATAAKRLPHRQSRPGSVWNIPFRGDMQKTPRSSSNQRLPHQLRSGSSTEVTSASVKQCRRSASRSASPKISSETIASSSSSV